MASYSSSSWILLGSIPVCIIACAWSQPPPPPFLRNTLLLPQCERKVIWGRGWKQGMTGLMHSYTAITPLELSISTHTHLPRWLDPSQRLQQFSIIPILFPPFITVPRLPPSDMTLYSPTYLSWLPEALGYHTYQSPGQFVVVSSLPQHPWTQWEHSPVPPCGC